MSRPVAALVVAQSVLIAVLGWLWLTRTEAPGAAAPADVAVRAGSSSGAAPVVGGAGAAPRDGVVDASAPVETAASREAVTTAAESDAALGLILWGKVRAQNGAKLPEVVHVGMRNAEAKRDEGARSRNGAYAALGLVPGKWKVSCKINGFASFEKEVELGTSEPRTRFDITLEPAIVVRVKILTPEGKPLEQELRALAEKSELPPFAEVGVIATTEQPAGNLPPLADWAYGVGQYRQARFFDRSQTPLPKEYAGEIELKATPPLWICAVLRNIVLDVKRLDPGQQEVTLTVAPEALTKQLATVRVQIVDGQTGQPLAGAKVSIGEWWGMNMGSQDTKDDGRAVLTNVRPGVTSLQASAKGYEQLMQQVRVEPAAEQDLGLLRVFKGETLKGTVVDASGKPVAVDLNAVDVDSPTAMGFHLGARSDAEGAFSLQRLGRRRYALRVFDKDRGGVVHLVDCTQGVPGDVRVRLQPVASVKVQKDSASALQVLIRDSRGLPAWTNRISGKADWDFSLPQGDYVVEIQDYVRPASSQPLTVGASGAVLRLP